MSSTSPRGEPGEDAPVTIGWSPSGMARTGVLCSMGGNRDPSIPVHPREKGRLLRGPYVAVQPRGPALSSPRHPSKYRWSSSSKLWPYILWFPAANKVFCKILECQAARDLN